MNNITKNVSASVSESPLASSAATEVTDATKSGTSLEQRNIANNNPRTAEPTVSRWSNTRRNYNTNKNTNRNANKSQDGLINNTVSYFPSTGSSSRLNKSSAGAQDGRGAKQAKKKKKSTHQDAGVVTIKETVEVFGHTVQNANGTNESQSKNKNTSDFPASGTEMSSCTVMSTNSGTEVGTSTGTEQCAATDGKMTQCAATSSQSAVKRYPRRSSNANNGTIFTPNAAASATADVLFIFTESSSESQQHTSDDGDRRSLSHAKANSTNNK